MECKDILNEKMEKIDMKLNILAKALIELTDIISENQSMNHKIIETFANICKIDIKDFKPPVRH